MKRFSSQSNSSRTFFINRSQTMKDLGNIQKLGLPPTPGKIKNKFIVKKVMSFSKVCKNGESFRP
jgi:hypothetical protein